MKLLFCNIGWMKNYDGIIKGLDDAIERGGKYNSHSIGHEVCNFHNNDGFLYGYVQPTGEIINIEKLGASKDDACTEDVTVVWTAGPKAGGTVIVGWYKSATVYRNLQEIEKPTVTQKNNGVVNFRIKAAASDSVLLPVEQRDLLIPRAVSGGIGQSNVWFADKPESGELLIRVKRLIERGYSSSLPDVDREFSAFEGNPRFRAHLRRERSPALVKAKKAVVLRENGRLCCEVCQFDFAGTYGELGNDFCEIHHLQPLSKNDREVETKLEDLSVVCSNCHRMIHRRDPMPTISELSALIKTAKKN